MTSVTVNGSVDGCCYVCSCYGGDSCSSEADSAEASWDGSLCVEEGRSSRGAAIDSYLG